MGLVELLRGKGLEIEDIMKYSRVTEQTLYNWYNEKNDKLKKSKSKLESAIVLALIMRGQDGRE